MNKDSNKDSAERKHEGEEEYEASWLALPSAYTIATVPDATDTSGNQCLLVHLHKLMQASLFPFHSLPAPPDVGQSLGQHDEVSLWRTLQDISRVWVTPAQTVLIEKHFQLPEVRILSHEGQALQMPSVGSHLIVFSAGLGSPR